MSYSELYIKRPEKDNSVIDEVKTMLEVLKPTRETFLIGLIRHIVLTNPKGVELPILIQQMQAATVDDKNLQINDKEEIIRMIDNDKFLTLTVDLKKSKELVTFKEGIKAKETHYTIPMHIWLKHMSVQAKNK